MQVLTDPVDVTPAWVEAALRRSGALREGSVAAVDVTAGHGDCSRIAKLRVRYTSGAAGDLPERLLLKVCADGTFGPSEVLYYTRDYADLADAPLVPCRDAAYDPASRRYHLLLDDVSSTHAPRWLRSADGAPGASSGLDLTHPTPELADALGRALGILHAHRWGAEGLARVGERLPAREDFERFAGHVGRGVEPLLATGAVDAAAATRIRRAFETLVDRVTERAHDARGMTLVHGDVNPGNALARPDGSGPVYLLDRQPFDWSLTRWLGASDLVYAMVVWWPTDARRALEERTLRVYHETLVSRGVADYPWERLVADYLFCVVPAALAVPVEWCVLPQDRERMRWLWSVQLRNVLAAMEDLGCDDAL